jgi:hypothetical protein
VAYFESESFVPQFAYNYECTDYFATTFFPVYIYTYAMLSFLVPLFTTFLLIPSISRRIPTRLHPFLPSSLLPLDELQHSPHRSQFTNALGVMSSLLYHFCMLLCLGILVPVLGVIIMIHITILVLQYDLQMGRHLLLHPSLSSSPGLPLSSPSPLNLHASPSSPSSSISPHALLLEVKSLWRGPYLLARYLLLLVVVVMSCFLLDQAGDRHGWRKGVWVIPTIIVTACLPAWFIWRYQPSMKGALGDSGSSSIFKVTIWLQVVDWLTSTRETRDESGTGGSGKGSYEILTSNLES